MSREHEASLGDDATFAGAAKRRHADGSLGDAQTIGDAAGGQDTAIDDIDVVDLESRYRIEGTLGQGGMGAVLLATDTRLDRKVAIKRILGESSGNRTAVNRFLTEAKSIAALNHPNVVQIYDYGRAKDGPFLIMEYVDGGSLLDRCRSGDLPLEEAIGLACQLCDGLGKAHDLGIIHRDIKPANVLLTKDGIPKLTDFGLAKAEAGDHGQTMTGAVLGTPDFMPPEQRRDASEVDHRSDLWSLAATVYQMVTGRSPKIIRFNDIPAALQEAMAKALEDRKDARYQSARELRDALKAASGGTDVTTKVSGPAAVIGDELQEGQCKACGTITSDLTKKFCRNTKCGASLRVACLKCEAQIPVWDGVCGECGGNQPAIIEARRQSLAAEQRKAEAMAAAFAFDEAISCASGIAAETRPEFAAWADWATSFRESTANERDRLRAAADQSVDEARRHLAAFDYLAAIHAIEAIPERLRDSAVVTLADQCRSRHTEAEQLLADITQQISAKEIDGLVPLVERAVELRGDRADLVKIRGQLRERRDSRIARAQNAIAEGDFRVAAHVLSGAVAGDFPEHRDLLERVNRGVSLEGTLVRLVKEANADGTITAPEAAGILRVAEEYLAINARSEKVTKLAAKCQEILERIAAVPPLENSLGMKLKLLPAGRFTMGEAGESHEVTLSRPFYIGVYEVTNAEWEAVMGSVPSNWKEANRPVEQVSWEGAVEFCRRLSAAPAEKAAGRVYRLPTEAEWEYACRAGTDTKYSFGDEEGQLSAYGWYDKNSGSQTHAVDRKQANGWGLYDMHGNVWEWCSDWYGEYPRGEVTDPQGPSEGSRRVRRGGCWRSPAGLCRSADRRGYDPSGRSYDLGFRLALSPSGAEPPEAGGR
jgi:formylglycine-generating enzyme required for sulfatase activity/serine/threonine protein kinase